jgi:kynurenine formamidase
LIGPARVIRIPGKSKEKPIGAEDLRPFKGLETEERLLLDTGWLEATWGGQDYFTEGPYLTPDAAHFIADLPKLKLLAMDFPNIDSTADMIVGKPAPNHQIILKKPVLLLENLNNFSQLPDRILLIAMPPKLTGGDGCPCRVAGLFPLNDVAAWLSKSGAP